MKAVVKKKINEAVVEFEFEGKDMKEIMLQAEPLLEKDFCWIEGFEDATIKWQTSLAEKDGAKYIYVKKVARTKDGRVATRTLGTYKGDFGNFWNKWEIYEKKNENSQSVDSYSKELNTDDINPEDVPF